MQFTTTIFTLYLAALSVAAPASLEKRVTGSITLFADKDFGGASQTFNFDVDAQTCIAATLPAGIDAQASSVRLSAENGGFNCRLTSYVSHLCPLDYLFPDLAIFAILYFESTTARKGQLLKE
jgi:hypothetical protein